MKREEQIKSEANFSYNGNYKELQKQCFIQGAKWADKTMINKVCAWLKQHKEDYNKYDAWRGEYVDFNALITDFKKAMQNE